MRSRGNAAVRYGDGKFMRTIAFLTQKGGAGKTTLAASLAAAAAHAGERVIALDLDPQASLLRWGRYREATNALNKVMIEPLKVNVYRTCAQFLRGSPASGLRSRSLTPPAPTTRPLAS